MRLVAGFSPRRPGFDLGPVHVRFVDAKLALGQGYSEYFGRCPVSIIPPMLRTHFHLQAARTRKTNRRSLGTFQKAVFSWKSRTLDRRVHLFGFLLALLCLQANAEMVPKITKLLCMLFKQPSGSKFVTRETMCV